MFRKMRRSPQALSHEEMIHANREKKKGGTGKIHQVISPLPPCFSVFGSGAYAISSR